MGSVVKTRQQMPNIIPSCTSLLMPGPTRAQELRIWQMRLDTSAVRTRGAIAATQDMLADETARARSDIAAICDKSERAVMKGEWVALTRA